MDFITVRSLCLDEIACRTNNCLSLTAATDIRITILTMVSPRRISPHVGVSNLPLWVWLGYSFLTILCFQSGLFNFFLPLTTAHYIALYIYLAAVHAAFACGFLRGSRYSLPMRTRSEPPKRHVTIALVGASAYCLISIFVARVTGLTFSSGLMNLGEARDASLALQGNLHWNHLLAVFSVFIAPLIGLIFFYWRSSSVLYRAWGVCIVLYISASSAGGGSRSGLYSIASMLIICLLASKCSGRARIKFSVLAPLCVAAIGLFITYSNWVIYDRHRLDRSADYITYAIQVEEIRSAIDLDHPLVKYAPRSVLPTLIQGVFYFGHAYNSLAYSLLKENEGWGFGLGHSGFLIRNAEKLVGPDAALLSKPLRLQLEEGVPSYFWFSTYMWIASDTTYVGSIVVFYFAGVIFGFAWKTIISGYNFWSMLCLLWTWSGLLLMHNTFIAADYAAWICLFSSVGICSYYWFQGSEDSKFIMQHKRAKETQTG